MYVNNFDEVIYIAHPRTASTATSYVLMQNGFEIVGGHHGVLLECMPTGYRVMATVRNPFDVLVSWYFNQEREQKSFEEWLPVFLGSNISLLSDGLFFGVKHATHVMRYETLQGDFDDVCQSLDIPRMTLPPRNVSKMRTGRKFMGFYNFQTAGMVVDRFRNDFLDNGYKALLRLP